MVEAFFPASWREPLRFLLVGLLNTAFGYAVFAALTLAGVASSLALVAAAVAGAAFNFQTYHRLVFRRRGRWIRFAATYAALLAANWAALRLARTQGLYEIEAQALLTLPFAALSYLCQKVFVFRDVSDAA